MAVDIRFLGHAAVELTSGDVTVLFQCHYSLFVDMAH